MNNKINNLNIHGYENKDIDKIDEIELLEKLKKDPSLIKRIENPSETLMVYSVNQGWNNLMFLKSPTRKVLEEAIKNKGWAIQYIDNPDEKLQLLAVNKDADAVQYIDNPSHEVNMAAVKRQWTSIKYMKNPDIKVKKEAIRQNEQALGFMNGYSFEELSDFVKENINVLKYNYDDLDELQISIILKEKFKEDADSKYIRDYMELQSLDIEKVKFMHEYGNKNNQKILADYILSR